jgi:hypothetical protein
VEGVKGFGGRGVVVCLGFWGFVRGGLVRGRVKGEEKR